MTETDDPFAGLGDGRARVREPIRGWRSPEGRSAFWSVAVIGTVILCVAWFWYGLAFHEEWSDQGKAVSAGTTMAGFGFWGGGVPLVFAHLLLLTPLLLIGAKSHSRRAAGIAQALAAVAVASAVGIAVNQWLFAGMLFTMYADTPGRYVP